MKSQYWRYHKKTNKKILMIYLFDNKIIYAFDYINKIVEDK
jgi:hypothetical protein